MRTFTNRLPLIGFSWVFWGLSNVGVGQIETGFCHGIGVVRPAITCDPTPLVLVFSDEFDGPSLDLSKWIPETGCPRDQDDAPHWFEPSQVSVSNGSLLLNVDYSPGLHTYVSDWNTNPVTQTTRNFDFLSGEVLSYFKYGEGQYEISCRIPGLNGTGLWPGFWMYGQDGSCDANEVDVFEYWDNDWFKWHTNVHRDVPCGNPNCGAGHDEQSASFFRTYALLWDRHNMIWWRDDTGVRRNFGRWYTTTAVPQIVGCPSSGGLYLMNEDYPAYPPIATTVKAGCALKPQQTTNYGAFPVYVEIDYIRYYRRIPCSGNAVFTNNTGLFNSNGEYNLITGTTLDFSGSVLLSSTSQLEARAVESVTMGPGFEASVGSNLLAVIGASNCGTPAGMVVQGGGEKDFVQPVAGLLEEGMKEAVTESSHRNGSSGQRYSVSPNPTSGHLVISGSSGQTAVCSVINLHGAVVRKFRFRESTEMNMDLSDLQNGVYVLEVLDSATLLPWKERLVISR